MATASEGADIIQRKLEVSRPDRLQGRAQAVQALGLGVTQEPQRQVQVRRRNPTELRMIGGALSQERLQRRAVFIRHRDPDERPDQGRRGFQCSGIQSRGEVALKLK
jgi:hypothetical protein